MPTIGVNTDPSSSCSSAIKKAFASGRRNGFWLAKNEPWKKESKDKSARIRDVFARKKQDDVMEGMDSMFAEHVEPEQAPLLKKTFTVKRPVVSRPASSMFADHVDKNKYNEPVEPEQAPLLKKTFTIKRPVVSRPASSLSGLTPQGIKLTPANASSYIGRKVFFTTGEGPRSATILSATASGIRVEGGPPSIKGSLSFSRKMEV